MAESTYVPPSLDDVETAPSSATENSKAPLLTREGASLVVGSCKGIPAAQLLEVPDATRMWKQQRQLMHIWLAVSSFSCIFFFPLYIGVGIFFPALIASILGLLASSMYLCSACWSTDMAAQVKATSVLGSVAAVMDAWNTMLAFMIVCSVKCGDSSCRALVAYMIFFALFLAGHGLVSYHMVRQARAIARVMNPISSGLVGMGV